MDFEEVWQDIIDNLNVGEEVYTLTQRVRNRITDVGRDSITVMPERTKKERKPLKRDFKPFVEFSHCTPRAAGDFGQRSVGMRSPERSEGFG